MSKIKAVIMDGDGSTIAHDTNGPVFPDNLRSLIRENSHIKWIMATGRSYDLLKQLPIIDYLSTDVPHILDGGSRLVRHDGVSLHDFLITEAELEIFFRQITPLIDQIEFLYYYLDETKSYFYSKNLDEWRKLQILQKATVTNDIIEYHFLTQQNKPTKIFMKVSSNIVLTDLTWHQNETNIDFTTHGVTKGSTCYKLLKMLNLSPLEVAFVFNDKNDLPLVEHPELNQITTIKVGDYLPDTKADYHVATPYEVADILHKIIK